MSSWISRALWIGVALTLPLPASGQVLRELEPIDLEYAILWGNPEREVVGAATVSFHPIDGKRGRRLEVKGTIAYILPRQTPFEYAEEFALICDETGVIRFDTAARALDQERVNIAIRMGEDFHLTTEFAGKKSTKTITAGVQRTNFGLFAGAFLAERLDEGPLMSDFPLLYPVGGDHQPRQKIRDAVIPFSIAGTQVASIQSTLRRKNGKSDRIWNAVKGHQILLRMEERSTLGLMVYELTSVNGVHPSESDLIQ